MIIITRLYDIGVKKNQIIPNCLLEAQIRSYYITSTYPQLLHVSMEGGAVAIIGSPVKPATCNEQLQ